MTLTTYDLRSELVPTLDVTAYVVQEGEGEREREKERGQGEQKIGVLTEKKFFS